MGDSSATYVRTEMLGEKDPPLSSIGLIGWARANLFSSILNAILTIFAVSFIAFILYSILPWIIRSSWTAHSLDECRQAISAAYGEGTSGACWAVIHERYKQLLFGFYPYDSRLIAGFVLMLVALSPVLFTTLPRKMLWFSAVYPFVGYWLLWGGSIWGPLMAVAGFPIGYFAFRLLSARGGPLVGTIGAIVVPILWWMLLASWVSGELHAILPIGIAEVQSAKFGGFALSITIGISGIAASLPLGILLALGRQSNLFIVKTICVGFIEFIRGVPLITLLFVASVLLNYFLPPGTSFDLILRVIIMVTLFSSAYIAEVIRGGLAALPRGQYEAADALGLNYWKSTQLIVLPQALKISIPGIVSTFIGLFKDTTLVSIIGLFDPLGLSNAIRANQEWNGIIWELYGFIAFMFFLFCFSMSRYSMYLERKLQTDHR